MSFLTGILASIGSQIAEFVWSKLEAQLEKYFETRSQISSISTEASALKEELSSATTDAERIQILRKIGDFSSRLGTN